MPDTSRPNQRWDSGTAISQPPLFTSRVKEDWDGLEWMMDPTHQHMDQPIHMTGMDRLEHVDDQYCQVNWTIRTPCRNVTIVWMPYWPVMTIWMSCWIVMTISTWYRLVTIIWILGWPVTTNQLMTIVWMPRLHVMTNQPVTTIWMLGRPVMTIWMPCSPITIGRIGCQLATTIQMPVRPLTS